MARPTTTYVDLTGRTFGPADRLTPHAASPFRRPPMTRKLVPGGTCACCGKVGAVFATVSVRPLDTGAALVLEADTTLPALCDTCNYAQARWDAHRYSLAHPGAGYPFAEGPPRSPPVRR